MRARLFLLGAALAAFGGSLLGGFHLDDYATFAGTGPRLPVWPYPLTQLVNWLNFQAAGSQPFLYHGVSLTLHLAAVLLAYECARRLLPALPALLTATVFAVHPLQAESVNYISARTGIVVAILALGALLAGLSKRRWIAAALAAVAAVEAGVYHPVHAYGSAALRYVRLLVAPWGFTIMPDLREPRMLSALAIVSVLGFLAWNGWTRRLRSDAGWGAIGLALLIPAASAYLALFAFAMIAGLWIGRFTREQIQAGGIAIAAVLIAVSVGRTYVWNSEVRLWREAVAHAPELAQPKIELAKCVRAGEALDLLNRARQQAPANAAIPSAIGKVLLDEGQYEGAVDELTRAAAMDPKDALAFNNRGVALAVLGQIPAAQADFQRALVLDPNCAAARENLKRLAGR